MLALGAILLGFILLVWSAGRFIDGAATTAGHLGMPSLLIGLVIVGFGTSAPEMVVSAMAAADGNPDLALGNALGSNIVNIGLILGITALIAPIIVHSDIVRRELPILLVIGLFAGGLLWNGELGRGEAAALLAGFFALVGWTVFSSMRHRDDSLGQDTDHKLQAHSMPLRSGIFWLIAGLVLLIISSRLLVWGAVSTAQALGVSDLIIGLTIVAFGTSLPELAASVMAARKGEHDIAIGNVVGSNMFNLLAVVGIAGIISPMPEMSPDILVRDWSVMMAMTIALLVMTYPRRGSTRLSRFSGVLLLLFFLAYNAWLITSVMSP